MANPWFRLYSEWADDPKVQMMPEPMQRRLVMLFCERCKNETLHETERAFHWRITEAELAETKALFLQKGFIDEHWNLVNWNKRQFISDSSTDRVRRYRQAKKQAETLQGTRETGNLKSVTSPDSDSDADSEPRGDAREAALPSIAPTLGADPEDEIPDGLAKVQYAAFVLEQLPVAANNALKIQTGDAIELIAKTELCTMAVATKRMLNRMRAAKRDGPVKWNFWLSEGQFTAEAHEMRNDSKPGKIDAARATSRATQNVNANKGAFRAAGERLRGSAHAEPARADRGFLPAPVQ